MTILLSIWAIGVLAFIILCFFDDSVANSLRGETFTIGMALVLMVFIVAALWPVIVVIESVAWARGHG